MARSEHTKICLRCKEPFTVNTGNKQVRYCSRDCANLSRRRDPEELFWSQVDKTTSPNGCWLWTGDKFQGYGRIATYLGTERAHRFSWILAYGPIPKGMHVCHHCDVTLCVRPTHLFLGTAAENALDMISKGRSLRGEKHPHAKLTEEQVRQIKEARRNKEPQKQVAYRFNISVGVVSQIHTGRIWQHVE